MTNGIVLGLSALAGVWLGWYALPICLSILVVLQIIERRRQAALIAICIVMVIVGIARSQEPSRTTTTPELTLTTGAIGTISSFPIPSGDGHRAIFELTDVCILEQCIDAESRVLVYFANQNPPLHRGQELRIDWRFDALDELPSGYRGFVISQGTEGSARASRATPLSDGNVLFRWLALANNHISTSIETFLPGDAGALATGIVTGDDSGLSDTTEANFQATGTSHITAVSGQNVTLIIGFLSLWFRPKTSRNRLLFHVLLFLAVWSFTLFVGMEAPAFRAAIVASLSIIGSHVGRKPDPVALLSLTLGIIALLQPLSVHSTSFWLSAAASMALCLALPKRRVEMSRRFAAEVLAAPVMASISTMPIALTSFGVWSPVGIITNILIAPVITLAFPVTYSFAIIASVLPPLASAIYWIPQIILEIALVIVNNMAPISMQWRFDSYSPTLLAFIWLPIVFGIWLASNESQRWIRRVLARRHATTPEHIQ